jgi:hypothetical protein
VQRKDLEAMKVGAPILLLLALAACSSAVFAARGFSAGFYDDHPLIVAKRTWRLAIAECCGHKQQCPSLPVCCTAEAALPGDKFTPSSVYCCYAQVA